MNEVIRLAFAHCFVDSDLVDRALEGIPPSIKNGTEIRYDIWCPLSLPRTREEAGQAYAKTETKRMVEWAMDTGSVDAVFVSRTVRKWLGKSYQENIAQVFQLDDNPDVLGLTVQILGYLSNLH